MRMLKKPYIWIVLVLTGTALLLWFNTSKKDNINEPAVQVVADSRINRVFIEDLHKYGSHFDASRHESIEQTLYSFALGSAGSPYFFTGSVRPGSLSQTSTTSGVKSRILIDVYPINVTYAVEVENATNGEVQPIAITCAPKGQQLDDTAKCKASMGLD